MFPLEHLAKCLADGNTVVHLFGGEFFGLPEDGGGGGVIAALDVGAAKIDEDLSAPFQQVGGKGCGVDLLGSPDGFGDIAEFDGD